MKNTICGIEMLQKYENLKYVYNLSQQYAYYVLGDAYGTFQKSVGVYSLNAMILIFLI